MKHIIEIIHALKSKGFKLEVGSTANQLKLKGNVQHLSDEDKQNLSEYKIEIIQFLNNQKDRKVVHASIPLLPNAEDYPLSSAQTRLWVLSQFEATNIAYNIPAFYELKGAVDKDQLNQAFLKVIARHEVLRTIFKVNEKGEVRQMIRAMEDFSFVLEQEYRQGQSRDDLTDELKQLAAQPFDLAEGPLLAAKLISLADNHSVLFFNMHHIVSDGWSMEVFLKEVIYYYQNPDTATLKALPLQYKDYASWQIQQLQSETMKVHERYWLDQFKDAIPRFELPTIQTRPQVMTYQGDSLSGSLSKELTTQLHSLSRKYGATLFMTLLAGWNVLFYRLSGQEEIILGSAVAGRTHVDLENQLGPYINILALKNKVDGAKPFNDFFKQVIQSTMAAYEHQKYPFDRLVAELNLDRDASRAALFDVMVILHNNKETDKNLEIEMQAFEIDQTSSKFDMTINFAENKDHLDYVIEYNSDLYSKVQIRQLLEYFEQLWNSILKNETQTIKELEYLSIVEKQMLLSQFNDTALSLSKEKTALDLFATQVKKTPEHIALVFGKDTLTYQALDQQSDHIAARLLNCSIQKGDLVGIYLNRSMDMVLSLLAILKAGAAFVPLDPSYPKERIAYILQDAGIKLTVTTSDLHSKMPIDDGACLLIDEVEKAEYPGPAVTIDQQDLAYVIYTSGSTGKPKGVLVEHGNLFNFFEAMRARLQPDTEKQNTLLAVTTMSFDISILELFWTLVNGFKVIIQPQLNSFEASKPVQRSTRKMDFSLFYFASEVNEKNKYGLLLEGAKFADRHGFSAIWTPERHFHQFGGIYPNPSVTGAAVAAVTKQVDIRAGSCVLPLHNPIRVVEEWSVLDNLSKGKVGLAFASGWVMNDFLALAPEDYDNRHEVLYQNIETIRRLWKGEALQVVNPRGEMVDLQLRPKPIQKELPIWITAAGNPETFRSAGKMGANLLTHLLGQTIEELADKIKIYRAARKEAGHEGEGQVTLMIHTYLNPDSEAIKGIVKEPFKNYLRHSVGLIRGLGKSIGQDVGADSFGEEDMEALLEYAFDRYFDTAALFGSPNSCVDRVHQLSHIGVDELACLVDFGLDEKTTIDGFDQLYVLKEKYAEQATSTVPQTDSLALIAQHQVTHLQCTPSTMKLLLAGDTAFEKLESISHLMLGGEALPKHLANTIHENLSLKLFNMYGPTETTIWSAVALIQPDITTMTIGRPIANTQLFILDKNLKIVPVGVPGEIYIGGLGVTRGYWSRPELTSNRFIENTDYSASAIYRTGDIGKWLEDGQIEFLGRADDQVKIRGHRIELGEIETQLRTRSSIEDVVVSTIQMKDKSSELVAYIISAEELELSDLKAHLKTTLPDYMLPTYLVQVEQFSFTPNGKIDKKALPNPLENGVAKARNYVAPGNELEEILVSVWAEVLELTSETIGIHHNFFELGGHSLNAVKLLSLIKQRLEVKVDLQALFYHPTIEGLAQEIELIRWTTNGQIKSTTKTKKMTI